MLGKYLENVRNNTPLVHNITNYVTVHDCANIVLACGGSPIMSDEPGEAKDIVSICGALNVNMGTLNVNSIQAMLLAAETAKLRGIPALFDPVGVGASPLRASTASQLLEIAKFSIIKGNVSEIKTLVSNGIGTSESRGVDASDGDVLALSDAAELAGRLGAVVVATAPVDVISDGKRGFFVKNGVPMMNRITGAGCMLSAMMAAYLGANPDEPLYAALAATCAMGVCGELAAQRISAHEGNATFSQMIIDEIYNLTPARLDELARFEEAAI